MARGKISFGRMYERSFEWTTMHICGEYEIGLKFKNENSKLKLGSLNSTESSKIFSFYRMYLETYVCGNISTNEYQDTKIGKTRNSRMKFLL